MPAKTDAQRAAARARRAIADVDGLATKAELARRWDVSEGRVRQLLEADDFPEPAAVAGGTPLWANAEVDEWRDQRPSGPGRPPHPTNRRYLPGDTVPLTGTWGEILENGRSAGWAPTFRQGSTFPPFRNPNAAAYAWSITAGGQPAVKQPLHRRR